MNSADRIGRRIKLRDLHILLAVEQRGSMARAAERLGISQPVVSKVVADLEHMMGVRLPRSRSQGRRTDRLRACSVGPWSCCLSRAPARREGCRVLAQSDRRRNTHRRDRADAGRACS